MDASSAKLACGIAKVCQISSAAANNETLVDEAWHALRTGIVSAQKDVDAFDSCTEEEIDCVLAFLAQRGIKRRTHKSRVNECLGIVLSSSSWLLRAQCHTLKTSLQELLAGNTELLEKLDPVSQHLDVPVELEEKVVPDDVPVAVQLDIIRQQLADGCQIMEGFGWCFPSDDILGTKLDDATKGVQSLYQGVMALSSLHNKAALMDGESGQALVVLEGRWRGLLQFLLSMYSSGKRFTFSARIRFIIENLRELSPEFRHLAPWRSLPWGHEPLPAVDAAEEAAETARREREEQDRRAALAQTQCMWMWTDAGSGALGFNEVAHLNPWRWSNRLSIQQAISNFMSYQGTKDASRPVRLQIPADTGPHRFFKTAGEAAEHLRGLS